MGCGESRVKNPFRERDHVVKWQITKEQWKNFVERTYTQEFVEESGAKVDCYELWKDMNTTEVGNQYVVGREVYMGKDFVSFGRILVPKDYWHSYEGTWVSDDLFFGSGGKMEYKVEKQKDGSLLCTATGQKAQGEQMGNQIAFGGQGRRLNDIPDSSEGAEGQKLKGQGRKLGDGGDVVESSQGGNAGEEANPEEKGVWRRMKNGKEFIGEVYVKSKGQWCPAELKFEGYDQLNVYYEGNKVGTFKREIPKEHDYKKFDGSDFVFGEITPKSDIDNEKCAKFMSLHLARVDSTKKILQVVATLGRTGKGKVSSMTVPIPANKESEVKRLCQDYRQFLKPLFANGRVYWNDDEVFRFMATWMLVDIAVTMCCFAIVSAMMADSALYAGEAGMYGAGDAGEMGGFGLLDLF